jgi:hypothetical protein
VWNGLARVGDQLAENSLAAVGGFGKCSVQVAFVGSQVEFFIDIVEWAGIYGSYEPRDDLAIVAGDEAAFAAVWLKSFIGNSL